MGSADFVHLHTHTEFSLLDAAGKVGPLIRRAAEMGFPGLAMTDHGNMFGAIGFYKAAKAAGINPIIGCEVYVAPGSRFEKKASVGRGRGIYHHLVLLAKDFEGYQNLVKLVTKGHLEGYYYKPRIDKELLEEHKKGLIALSGCLASEIPSLITQGQESEARETIDWFKQTLGPGNFYLEMQNHGIPEQMTVNKTLIPWAKEFDLKLVATNDVHYINKSHSHAHDCLICIGTQSHLNEEKRMRYVQEQFYLRSAEEMGALFSEVPHALLNTVEVSEKCNLEIKFGEMHYPSVEPPEGKTREGLLCEQLAGGLKKRYGLEVETEETKIYLRSVSDPKLLLESQDPAEAQLEAGGKAEDSEAEVEVEKEIAPEYAVEGARDNPQVAKAAEVILKRIDHEMKVIEKMGYTSYFLIVGDFVEYGRGQGISCVARGSAAGSIVAYLLEISNVDPIRYGLIFERFLNPERVSPPDIDIDFADDRRQDVIEYTRKKYGNDCVAQIVTFGTMGAKSVVRDVGRVMGLSFSDTDRLAKMIPAELKMTLTKALAQSPDFKQAYETEDQTRELIDTALILEDVTRNTSVHAAGVVIGAQPLVNVLPLKDDGEGALVTQYPMGPVEDLGLLKMDFLGLKTLTVIRNAVEMAERNFDTQIPIDRLPFDDEKTYELLNKGATVGVFQLESSGMRDLCRKFQIQSIEHITALIALYRPGPMDLIPDFINRRHGRVKVVYEHPLLEPVCSETYGIMIYQEQVMRAAQVLAGFTLGAADLLRRAMGKKKVEVMQEQRAIFVKGCQETNKIPEKKANDIFDILEKFAGYGFNKSHAAAYAIVSYQTAYLKANYPVEFLAALMTNDMGNMEKLSALLVEARVMGIRVAPPHVNESESGFTSVKGSHVIRFGLAAVKGVGSSAVDQILESRAKGGPFKNLQDMLDRVDTRAVNRKALEALIKCGALEGLGPNRASLCSQIESALSRASKAAQDRMRGQSTLFDLLDAGDDGGNVDGGDPAQPELEEWPESEILQAEKDLLGFYVTGHPLEPYRPLLENYGVVNSETIKSIPDRSMTRIGGIVTGANKGFSKKSGKPYAMATLEDMQGSYTLLLINETFDQYSELVEPGRRLLVTGEVSLDDDTAKLFPVEIIALERAARKLTRRVQIRIRMADSNTEKIKDLHQLLSATPGRCPVWLVFIHPKGPKIFLEVHERISVDPGLELQRAVESILGEGSYHANVNMDLPNKKQKRWAKKEKQTETA